jgi:hypothetical protein
MSAIFDDICITHSLTPTELLNIVLNKATEVKRSKVVSAYDSCCGNFFWLFIDHLCYSSIKPSKPTATPS